MNQDLNSFSSQNSSGKNANPIKFDLDDFQISEETFKPMTKGLGFHQESKKVAFKSAPKEVKTFASPKAAVGITSQTKIGMKLNTPSSTIGQQTVAAAHMPSGLEAFYGNGAAPVSHAKDKGLEKEVLNLEISNKVKVTHKKASALTQLSAWMIDLGMILSFLALTAVLLVFASGIEFQMYSRLISSQDLAIFTASMFSIYYLLYFTILELGTTPGKTIMGIRLARTNGGNVAIRHSFARAFISLCSFFALCLPLLLDFQGRLTDTEVVKQ